MKDYPVGSDVRQRAFMTVAAPQPSLLVLRQPFAGLALGFGDLAGGQQARLSLDSAQTLLQPLVARRIGIRLSVSARLDDAGTKLVALGKRFPGLPNVNERDPIVTLAPAI